MNKCMRSVTAAMLALTLCGGIQPALAATGQPLPVTKEQQEALQRYRSQQEILQTTEQEIRALMRVMKADSKQLRQELKQKQDKSLQAKVKTDLQPFHEKVKQAHRLHKTGEALTKKIHAARANRDLAELRALTEQLVESKKMQLQLLKSAYKDLQSELKTVR